MAFGPQPQDGSTPTIPTSSVYVENTGFVTLRGSAVSTDGSSNDSAAAHVITQSGSVVQANAGTNLNTSALALESGGNLATIAGAVSSSKVATKAASGDFADGSIATLGAKADSSVTDHTTTNSTQSFVKGLVKILADIWDSTNHLLHTNVKQVGGNSVSTAATGVQKVGIVGNGGATLDSTVGAGSAPTNAVVTGLVYNSSAPAPTNGQAMAIQSDQAGNTRVFPGIALTTLSAWNSGTSANATQNIFTNSGANAVLVQLTQTSTLTAGAVTFEVTYDGTNWSTIPASAVVDPTSVTFTAISLPYTVQASTNKVFLFKMNGAQGLRVKLSTQITGSGTVTPNYALLPFSPAPAVSCSTPYHAISSSGTNSTNIKPSAGQVCSFAISNSNASARYFKLYDKATAPTIGTDTPKMTIMIPGSGVVVRVFPEGSEYLLGIGYGLTTGIGNSDTGSVGTDIAVSVNWK